MNDGTLTLPWRLIREDDNGNRYSVGRYATRAEAERTADRLDARGHKQMYWVECVGPDDQGGTTTLN
ncbi:SPOR domain-containing protein [Streptomyces sp. NPDC087425]|uniref:SPOR domain-containing protein n=1 Tax=unclassified Streptomyces TaxID=2593676 RepID=UPI003822F789